MLNYNEMSKEMLIAHIQTMDMQLNAFAKAGAQKEYRIAELEHKLQDHSAQAFGIGETYANALSRIAYLERRIEFNGDHSQDGIAKRDERIAELEAQVAAASAPTDTDKLREAIFMAGIPTMAINGMNDFSSWESECWARGALAMRVAVLELMNSTALQAPVREVPEGMPVSQEPKYGIRDNRLFNRASGEFIPEDEPVFIFRARDWHATGVLMHYKQIGLQQEHWEAVTKRLDDFMAFSKDHPERMKEPDTALPAAPVQQEGA